MRLAAPMRSEKKIQIHQIYYMNSQLSQLDSAFVPYDNSASEFPDEREFYVFRKEYLAGAMSSVDLSGYFSWKFREKTGLEGKHFIGNCLSNPGHDVYFVNPFPIEICYGNVWAQGEMWTPGITRIAQEIIDACGYSIELRSMPRTLRTLAFCNFWAGSPDFWERYMDFCLKIYDYIRANSSGALTEELLQVADLSRNASYFSFIFERLFSTFLTMCPDIRFSGFTYSRAELRRRYPRAYADFIANLQELEAEYPEDPQPIQRSPSLLKFIDELDLAIEKADTARRRHYFNRAWNAWTSSSIRQALSTHAYFHLKELEFFHLFNPGYVHWRKDRRYRQ
jgi:hypothetical protein